MLTLPNGCKCSTPSIFPKNWQDKTATTKEDWRIQYYFYDAAGKASLKILKAGVNELTKVADRRAFIRQALSQLIKMLEDGYNPVTKENPVINAKDISPATGFVEALHYAYSVIKVNPYTKVDMKSVVKYTSMAAAKVGLDFVPLEILRRKHVKLIFDKLGEIKKDKWTDNNYNVYRSYLGMLFNELIEYEAAEINIFTSLRKKTTEKKLKKLLSDEERIKIDTYLRTNVYSFWRFMNIFFHSGSRIIELLSVKLKDVDFKKQYYKVLVKKGKQYIWHERPIKDVSIRFWREAVEGIANPETYLFHEGLLPGLADTPIRREQITRRWRLWVKTNLGIKVDFNSLRHSNLDETAAVLDIEAAAKMAGHTSTTITRKHYAINEDKRQKERLKKVNNPFV